jgi:hypothetical protein
MGPGGGYGIKLQCTGSRSNPTCRHVHKEHHQAHATSGDMQELYPKDRGHQDVKIYSSFHRTARQRMYEYSNKKVNFPVIHLNKHSLKSHKKELPGARCDFLIVMKRHALSLPIQNKCIFLTVIYYSDSTM